MDIPFIKNSNVPDGYNYVIKNFDELLAKHGYVRKGKYYEVANSNKDTLVIFCHLGLECVLLSRLFNLPFIALTQHFAPAPSAVSVIYTEERKPGIAQFRAQCLGDLSHLYVDNIEPSFMARFRECAFDDTRKD
jgi:probable phosphoglycerate mutase